MTNPPYSSDHVEKLFQFVSSNKANKCFVCCCHHIFVNASISKRFVKKQIYFYCSFETIPLSRTKRWEEVGIHPERSKNAPFINFWYCALPSNTPFGERKKIFKKMKQSFVKYNIEAASRQNNLQDGSRPNSIQAAKSRERCNFMKIWHVAYLLVKR